VKRPGIWTLRSSDCLCSERARSAACVMRAVLNMQVVRMGYSEAPSNCVNVERDCPLER